MSYPSLSCVTLLLLCCACLCAEPPALRRQKRGIMKMMMHVMWDPVRLIRYWYAYDVTKEIAKSWRKIIPTILLLPFSPHPLAKYVHPTVGLRDANKGSAELQDHVFQKVPYEIPQQQSVSSSSTNVSPVSYQHLSGGVRYTSLPAVHQGLEGMKDAQHFFLQPLHQEYQFGQSSERKDEHFIKKVPLPYKIRIPGPDGKQMLLKGIPVPLHSAEDQFPKGGTDHSVSLENSDNAPSFPQLGVFQKNYAGSQPESSSYFEKGHHYPSNRQEIHIVLHPIPVSDPERFQKAAGSNGFHFVPFYPNSSDLNGRFPFAFPADENQERPLEEASENLEATSANHSDVDEKNPQQKEVGFLDLKDHNVSSSEMYDARPASKVIWMLNRDPAKHQSKNPDHQSAESALRVNSVHRAYEDGHENRKRSSNSSESSPHQLNRLDIDLAQLKEDLKHGTPVLIPFNKKVLYPARPSCKEQYSDSRESTTPYPKMSTETEDTRSVNLRKEPIILNLSGERFEDNNSTQRLLLFLTKKQSSHHPG